MSEKRVLVIATMFPNRALPVHAVFVQQRVRALSRRVPVTVCSPVPWFPLAHRFVSKYSHRPGVPSFEDQDGLECHFPRFTSIPMLFKPLDGWFVYRALKRFVREQELTDRIALLDAHLAFPEGWAAVRLGRELGVPVSVTLRGHDINELAQTRGRRRMVVEALRGADRVFGVARALCDAAIEMGADPTRTITSSNGVDLERFHPVDQTEARQALGLPPGVPIILSVGHLVRRKGNHLILEAVSRLHAAGREKVHVVLVGAGGEEGNCETELRELGARLGFADRLRFAGAVPNPELLRWYGAADVLCLSSEKEGWPNVVLESLACARPVVATSVWGTPEILPTEDLGLLVRYGDIEQLARALARALDHGWDRGRLRAHAESQTWDATAAGLVAEMKAMLADRGKELP